MEIRIKERNYTYSSDFPEGWVFSRGDHFKFPVIIGTNTCFIKRFQKSTAAISGWTLIKNLTEKFEPNLARVYYITTVSEDAHTVHYIFYEFIEGKTLHELVAKKIKFDLSIFTNDLFTALQTLQKRGHWFPDFFEKNFFVNNSGRFQLIDLDSAQPLEDMPANGMWGCKDYWAMVFKFCKEVLHLKDIQPSYFYGASFNYLHAIFLILRLRIFYLHNDTEYDSVDFFNQLPHYLDDCTPSFREIFKKVYDDKAKPLDAGDITMIKELVQSKIINNYNFKELPVKQSNPELINTFQVANYLSREGNNYTVTSGKTFNLQWDVQHVTGTQKIELLKNGVLFSQLNNKENSLSLKEDNYDGKEKSIEYTLVISDNTTALEYVEKNSVQVTFIDQHQKTTVLEGIKAFYVVNYLQKDQDEYIVQSGLPFTLRWDAADAGQLEILKNGQSFNIVGAQENSIVLTEQAFDGKEKKIGYTLVARSVPDNENNRRSVTILVKETAILPPVISQFKTNKRVLRNGGTFILSWTVQNAAGITLYKNGVLYKTLDSAETSTELNESYDGKAKVERYALHALNNTGEVKSESLDILVKPAINFIKSGLIVLSAATILWFVIFLLNNRDLKINPGKFKSIYYGDTLLVLGKHIPENDSNLVIRFNYVKADILFLSKDSIRVKVPHVTENLKDVNIFLWVKDKIYTVARHVVYQEKIKSPIPVLFSISKSMIFRNDTLTITGANLPVNDNAVKIFINKVNAVIIQQAPDSIRVLVPDIKEKLVTVTARINGTDTTLALNIPYQTSGTDLTEITIYPVNQNVVHEGDVLVIKGLNLPRKSGEIIVRFNAATAAIVQQTGKTVSVQVPSLPKEVNKVNITVFTRGKVMNAGENIPYQPVQTTINANNQPTVMDGKNYYISGKNIPTNAEAVQVLFNNVKAKIIDLSQSLVQVQVPLLPSNIKTADVSVQINGKNYVVASGIMYQHIPAATIDLCDLAAVSLVVRKKGVLKLGKHVAEISLQNNSKFTMESVQVAITYTGADGNTQTEDIEFKDVLPGTAVIKQSGRAIKDEQVKAEVKSVSSKEFGLQKK